MKAWLKTQAMYFWVWFAIRIVGWHKVEIHTGKDEGIMIGVTFGHTEEMK